MQDDVKIINIQEKLKKFALNVKNFAEMKTKKPVNLNMSHEAHTNKSLSRNNSNKKSLQAMQSLQVPLTDRYGQKQQNQVTQESLIESVMSRMSQRNSHRSKISYTPMVDSTGASTRFNSRSARISYTEGNEDAAQAALQEAYQTPRF